MCRPIYFVQEICIYGRNHHGKLHKHNDNKKLRKLWYYDEEVVEQQLGIGSSSSGSLI